MSRKSGPAEQKRHASAAATELEPLSRRCLRAAGALSLLLVLVVVNSLLNDGSASPFNPNPVAAAAERTQEAPGMRFAMVMRVSVNGSPTGTITGKGTYDNVTHLAGIAYRAEKTDGEHADFDAVLGEDGWYYRYPEYTSKMPAGKEWVKVEGLPGQNDASKMSESPDDTLQMLAGAGSVRQTGHVRIGKVPTTRYRAVLTAEGLVDALRSQGKDELADAFEEIQLIELPTVEVFIDRGGMLRRVRTVTTMLAEGKTIATDVRTDFFDFGINPNIQVPDDSQVYDLTPLLEEKLDALGQSS